MSENKDDISTLIGLGIISVIGEGVYKMLRPVDMYFKGQQINNSQLVDVVKTIAKLSLYNNPSKIISEPKMRNYVNREISFDRNDDMCNACGTVNPPRCAGCGGCSICMGGAGGGGCNSCDSD